MPRTKEQYEALREATRGKIHSVAIKLFAQKGLAATGIQEIADTAGVSVGLLYRHYKTKDDIFGAMVAEALAGLGEAGKLFESRIPPADALRAFTCEFINDVSSSDEFVEYMMLLSSPFFTNQNFPWMKDLLEQNKHLRSRLAQLIKKGQRLGQFKRGNADKLAQFYFSIVQGVCTMKYILKEVFIPPTADMVTAFLLMENEQL